MDLSKILSISGRPGLYQIVSQLKNAVLVESLLDKKRFPAFAHEKISSLEEISVFTPTEDKPLKDVLKAIYDKLEGKPALDPKSGDKILQAFFLEVVPDYDSNRVYISDIRKIISWYNILTEHKILDFTEKEEEKPEAKAEETTEEKKEEKKEAVPEEIPIVTAPGTKKKKTSEKKSGSEKEEVKKKETTTKKTKKNPL
jgi:outer membrane biosynthesis protein TonB